MDAIEILSILSGALGIVGFFFPVDWKRNFVVKIAFASVLVFLSGCIYYQNDKISRIERVSKSARMLVENKDFKFTSEGFILASLSFLEQNKGDFPDSYSRAEKIFEKYNNSENKSLDSVDVSFEMAGLIEGIAILSSAREERRVD